MVNRQIQSQVYSSPAEIYVSMGGFGILEQDQLVEGSFLSTSWLQGCLVTVGQVTQYKERSIFMTHFQHWRNDFPNANLSPEDPAHIPVLRKIKSSLCTTKYSAEILLFRGPYRLNQELKGENYDGCVNGLKAGIMDIFPKADLKIDTYDWTSQRGATVELKVKSGYSEIAVNDANLPEKRIRMEMM